MPNLYVISGHGNGDVGACGNGYQEYERVRALATKIKLYGGDKVKLHPFSDNAYQSNAIGKGLPIDSSYCVLELHLDSASASAKGGHVIIQEGVGGADQWDNALADYISSVFPGRDNKIVERNNLANPSRASAKGYNYRLLECCFISNASDISKFNSNLDSIAKGILKCFGIGTSEKTAEGTHLQKSDGSNAQKWIIEKEGDYCRIKSKASGMYLDVKDGSSVHNTPVRVHKGNGTKAQLWKLDFQDKANDKWFYLKSALDENKVLACYKGGKAAGTGTVIGTFDEANAQKWAFVWAGETSTYFIVNLVSGMMLDVDNQ